MANTNAPDGFTYERRFSYAMPPVKEVDQADSTDVVSGDPVAISGGDISLATGTDRVDAIVAGSDDRVPGDPKKRIVTLTFPDIEWSVQTNSDVDDSIIGKRYETSGSSGEVVLDTDSGSNNDGAWEVKGLRDWSEWGEYARVIVQCVKGYSNG